MTAHAKLSPSSADRWMVCTASVAEIDRLDAAGLIRPPGSSGYADEGTAAHAVREMSLSTGLSPFDFVGQTITVNGVGYPVTEDMADHLQPGIDSIYELASGRIYVEERIDLSSFIPDQFGTLDAGWLTGTILGTSDLKYGAGEEVSAEENRQQMLYQLGLWDALGRPKVTGIVIFIDQPRLGGLKSWDAPFSRLMQFADEVAVAWEAISSGNTIFVPTKKGCRWCRMRDPNPRTGYMGCAAFNAHQVAIFADAFDDLDAPEPAFKDPTTQMTREQRAYIVQHAAEARKWLAKVHDASLAAALMGDPDPGLKAIKGRMGARYFTDPSTAEALLVQALADGAFKPREIIGITEAEKLMKPGRKKLGHPDEWEALQPLISQKPGKPVLVASDHPGDPVVNWTAEDFDDLETDQPETDDL